MVIVGLIGAIRPQTYDMGKTYYKDVICGTLTLTAEIVRERLVDLRSRSAFALLLMNSTQFPF